jgi:hypothetical protein
MRFHLLIPALILLAALPSLAQEADVPVLAGYVTRVDSANFDVNGTHVLLTDKTRILSRAAHSHSKILPSEFKPYLGQHLKILGNHDRKPHAITAARIELEAPQNARIAGSAIVDAVLDPPTAGDHLLRADGYRVLIPAAVLPTFAPPLDPASAFHTNVWITFSGKRRPDGVVLADKVGFRPNSISNDEDKLRSRTEHDPAAVDPGAKQSGLSRAFRGTDPTRIPPYKDADMQARIDSIGARLVPQYQRELASGDDTRIDFRFQLVDQPKWHDAQTWPNGIILVPRQVVERLQDDSQLAAVLAENVACALEKQSYRFLPTSHTITAASVAGALGGAFVPGLGLASTLGGEATREKILRHLMEQDARVSLFLMHDAGFDITQAPLAWWLLADEKSDGLENTPLPPRAEYLYKTLGEAWHSQ